MIFRGTLQDLSLVHWLLVTILPTIIGIFVGKKWGFWWKQQKRFFSNLQRPIAIITNKANLDNNEIVTIQTNGIFNFKEEDLFETSNQFTWKKNYGLIIIIYNDKVMAGYKDIVLTAKNRNLPILLYANHKEIDWSQLTELKQYPNMHLSQYSMNFISAIFTTLATFNYGHK